MLHPHRFTSVPLLKRRGIEPAATECSLCHGSGSVLGAPCWGCRRGSRARGTRLTTPDSPRGLSIPGDLRTLVERLSGEHDQLGRRQTVFPEVSRRAGSHWWRIQVLLPHIADHLLGQVLQGGFPLAEVGGMDIIWLRPVDEGEWF